MALTRPPVTAADGTFSATGSAAWAAGFGVAGATSGGIPYFSSATGEASSALLTAASPVLGGGAGTAPYTDSGFTSSGTGATFNLTAQGGLTSGLAVTTADGSASAPALHGATATSGIYFSGASPAITSANTLITYWTTSGMILQLANGAFIPGGSTQTLGQINNGFQSIFGNNFHIGQGTTKIAISGTAPTISSGFGTNPSIASNNGTATFRVNVGTGGTASTGVIGLPTASNGWNAVLEIFNPSATNLLQDTAITASDTGSITLTNYTISTGLAAAWPASTVLIIHAVAY